MAGQRALEFQSPSDHESTSDHESRHSQLHKYAGASPAELTTHLICSTLQKK
jgi:hypothetical protein